MLNRTMNMRFRYKTYVSNAWELKQEEGIVDMQLLILSIDTFKGHYRRPVIFTDNYPIKTKNNVAYMLSMNY